MIFIVSVVTIVQKIVIFYCAGLTFGDIFFDSLLTVEYYHQYNNESFVESAKVQEVIQLSFVESANVQEVIYNCSL